MKNRFDFIKKYINDAGLTVNPDDNYILVYAEAEPYLVCNADYTEWYTQSTEWVRWLGHRSRTDGEGLLAARKYVRRLGYDLCGYEQTQDWTYIYHFRNRATKEVITLHAQYFEWAGETLKNYLDGKEV